MISHLTKAVGFTMIAAVVACDTSTTGPRDQALSPRTQASTQGAILAEIRGATAQFHDVNAAVAAGYVVATGCLQNEGIRYRKPALFDAVIDLEQPELLIYEPLPDSELRLVAVQYLVASAAWDATHSSPPTVGGQAFMDRRTPPFGAAFPNYSLVVWAWAHNPAGMYTLQNPTVSC
jgi:hypothetical protein